MTPTRRNFRGETSLENTNKFLAQNNPYKLPAGLINISFLQNGHNGSIGNRFAQRSTISREELNRRFKPRLTYSRWNMMISSRYKTELCRQFEEEGVCHFDEKCLFAHGRTELRPLPRHPKYKTELCRDFHDTGFCSFGPRCNFVHSSTDVLNPEHNFYPSSGPLSISGINLSRLEFSLAEDYQSDADGLPPITDAEAYELRQSDCPFNASSEGPRYGVYGAIGEPTIKNIEDHRTGVDYPLFGEFKFF